MKHDHIAVIQFIRLHYFLIIDESAVGTTLVGNPESSVMKINYSVHTANGTLWYDQMERIFPFYKNPANKQRILIIQCHPLAAAYPRHIFQPRIRGQTASFLAATQEVQHRQKRGHANNSVCDHLQTYIVQHVMQLFHRTYPLQTLSPQEIKSPDISRDDMFWDYTSLPMPIATGSRNWHHWLQEPGYSFGMGKPAWQTARMLWHAVTPEPQ